MDFTQLTSEPLHEQAYATLRNALLAISREGGALAAHWSRQLTWKKTEPRSRTLRSTSDSGSMPVIGPRPLDRRTREQVGATPGEACKGADADHAHTDNRCVGNRPTRRNPS